MSVTKTRGVGTVTRRKKNTLDSRWRGRHIGSSAWPEPLLLLCCPVFVGVRSRCFPHFFFVFKKIGKSNIIWLGHRKEAEGDAKRKREQASVFKTYPANIDRACSTNMASHLTLIGARIALQHAGHPAGEERKSPSGLRLQYGLLLACV